MAKASLQSISAALRYIESLRLDTFSEIVGKDLHQSYTSPLSKDSANTLVLTDETSTLTLRGSDAYQNDFDDEPADLELDNFSFDGIGIRWRRSADAIEEATVLQTEQLTTLVQRVSELLESIRATAENSPPFRDKIREAAASGLWNVWINAETRDVQPAPQF